jgi:hypothetical protein
MEACICVFSFSFFCLWQEGSNLGDPAWGVAVIVSFNGGYLTLFFFKFHLQLWSQIYTTPLHFPRHAPLSNVPIRRPLQPQEAQARPRQSSVPGACKPRAKEPFALWRA